MAHSKLVHALNTLNGKVAPVPAHYIDHPVLGENLVEVPEGTKDYDEEFWHATDAKSHRAKSTTRRKTAAKSDDEVVADAKVEETKP